MGRPKINDITKRKWFLENVEQTESDGEWDHLIWEGEGIDKYRAPKVTSPYGVRNVRRVMWAEMHNGVLPPTNKEVIPNCEWDRCISPRHAELIDRAAASYSRYHNGEERIEPNKPWLKASRIGNKWEDFSQPFGQAMAYFLHEFTSMLEARAVKMNDRLSFEDGVVAFNVTRLPGPVRAAFLRNWENDAIELAIADILDSGYIEMGIRSAFNLINRENEKEGGEINCFWLYDSDENSYWMIRRPESASEEAMELLIRDPKVKPPRPKARGPQPRVK